MIDQDTYEIAKARLPDITSLWSRVLGMEPNIISQAFEHESTFPIAAACFRDVKRFISESRYALGQSYAFRIWYLDKLNPPDELTGTYFSRFYAEDVALRLYSSAEHLAKAIVCIFEISPENIKANSSESRFKKVCEILKMDNMLKSHPITLAMVGLYNSENWQKVIKYRNNWVHNQPPIIENAGIAFHREKRWKHSENNDSYVLEYRPTDAPDYSIDELHNFLHPALCEFLDKLTVTLDYYEAELNKHGITISHKLEIEKKDD